MNNLMTTLALTAISSLAITSTSVATIFNTHVGISVGAEGQLVTEGWISGDGYQGPDRVFAFDSIEFGGSDFFDIGTNSVGGTFATPGTIGFNFMGPLQIWNGNGFDAAGTTLTMQFGPFTATSGQSMIPGLGTAVRDENSHPTNPAQWGRHHNHFDFYINNNPTSGLYMMEITLWYEAGTGNPISYDDSASFWMLFNLNGDTGDVVLAHNWVEANLVPAPGAIVLFALAGIGSGRRRCA